MVPFRVSCEQFEAQLGCQIKSEWFDNVRTSVDQAQSSDTDKLNLLFALFLEADMNVIGAGSFPLGVKVLFELHSKFLPEMESLDEFTQET